jgi:hypothetical protein
MICNIFYDECVDNCIDQYIEQNIKGKNPTDFILTCIEDLTTYDYTDNDHKIVDMRNLERYMTKRYSPEYIFKSMNGKQAAEAIEYFKDVDYIDEMLSDEITLEEMLAFYYIAYLHFNKHKIIKRLLEYI